MKNYKIIAFFLFTLLISASCSKEKRIEKSLSKKGGEWKTKSFVIDNYVNGNFTATDVYGTQGKMTFSENGSVIWRWDEDGYISDIPCTWSNTEDKLTINFVGDVLIFDITNRKKESMDLQAEFISYSNTPGFNNTYKEVYKMTLEKN